MVAMAIVSFERGGFFPGLRFHGVFLCIPTEGPVFIYYYVFFIKLDYPHQRSHDNRFRNTHHNGFAHGGKGKETTGYGRGGLTITYFSLNQGMNADKIEIEIAIEIKKTDFE